MATEAQEAAKIDELEVAAGRDRENLEGWIPSLASESEVREALEKAFDYRGDISVTRKDGSTVEGYLFDRRPGATLETSLIRIIPSNSANKQQPTKLNVAYSEIAALAFSGRDTAAGKTFDAWVKKYWEKKGAGEKDIRIEPEKLD